MALQDTAMEFFDAIETGKGWEGVKGWCHPDAGFDCQAGMLAGVVTLEGYADWMKGLIEAVPDGRYELKMHGPAADGEGYQVFAVFHGTRKGEGGDTVLAANYVYAMTFEDRRVRHMTKIWNDTVPH